MTLAKLQTPAKQSFDELNADIKDMHSGLNRYQKILDKVGVAALAARQC